MYELVILISRLFFDLLIGLFVLLSIFYVLTERGLYSGSKQAIVAEQRLLILVMHVSAFLIVSYKPESNEFSIYALATGAAFIVFFIYAIVTLSFFYRHSCSLLWNCVFFFLDVGLIMLMRLGGDDSQLAQKQLVWMFIGYTFCLILPLGIKIIKKLELLEYIYLIAGYLLIISPFFLGTVQNGALNWIEIKGFGFQPSEIVKFLYVFFLATVFRKPLNQHSFIVNSTLAAVFVVILALQKDLGGAFIYFIVYLIIVYISTGSKIIVGSIAAGTGVAGIFAYKMAPLFSFSQSLFNHVEVRAVAWLNPWSDISGKGYQIARSLFAIGTWGLLGSGLTRGYPNSIPNVETDFIFSAICEEFGSLFGLMLLAVFMIMFYRGVHISLRCQSIYYSLLASGFTAILALQTFIIIGGVIKMIPLTGVTLPFISYGGSSITVCMLMVGILAYIHMDSQKHQDEMYTDEATIEKEGEGANG